MNTPWVLTRDLISVNEEQVVRATRYTWQRAASQRRPGRWVANWFRRHWPDRLRRHGHARPVDLLAGPQPGKKVSPMIVEPYIQTAEE